MHHDGSVGLRPTERGAAAVEFALVSLVLFPLVLGLVQYGLFFNDSLQLRQATRLGARSGVVWATLIKAAPCDGVFASDAARLACFTKAQSSPASGKVAVLVKTDAGWARGNTLLVCAVVQSASASAGLVPVPNGGVIRSITAMSIEKDATTAVGFTNPTVSTTGDYATDFATNSDPSGAAWTWCTL